MYVYDWTAETFLPLPDMPQDLPLLVYKATKALQLIDEGKRTPSVLLRHFTLLGGCFVCREASGRHDVHARTQTVCDTGLQQLQP